MSARDAPYGVEASTRQFKEELALRMSTLTVKGVTANTINALEEKFEPRFEQLGQHVREIDPTRPP